MKGKIDTMPRHSAKSLTEEDKYDKCLKYISIQVQTEEEKQKVAANIHRQLVGNSDYINSNILLNMDEPYTVQVWIFEGCKTIPKLEI